MTFSADECPAYDGPHCDHFTSSGESCCYCREVPPPPPDDLLNQQETDDAD